MLVSGSGLFVLVLLALALAIVFAGVKTVPQGYEFTVERFQRYIRTLSPASTSSSPSSIASAIA